MTRTWVAKVFSGLALLGPIGSLAWADDPTAALGVQIYSTEKVVQQAMAQDKATAPEQAVPKSTEGKDQAAPANGAAEAKEEEAVGTLQECLRCTQLGSWMDCNRVKVSGHIEQGFTWNPDEPDDRQNFGRLFDDRSNDYRLNQIILTFERALDPKPCCTDWGFKTQLMYGSDARFIHSLGVMDNVVDDTVQPDIVEMYWTYHMPVLTEGGVDLKVGQFVTLMGADVIYAPANYTYSHSYIFNFGIPFKHTGVLATTHVTPQLDIHAGLVAGINTGSFDDNNDAWAYHGGFMWKSCDERLTVNGSFHAGPENDGFFNSLGADTNDDFRFIESMQVTYKWNECFTTITDLNAGQDEAVGINAFGQGNSEWYGVSQYFLYQINKCLSAVARIEIWRDDDGFAAFKDISNDGFIDLERGIPGPGGFGAVTSGGDTTYTALTLGLNYKPYENLLFRPELRWDWADVGEASKDTFGSGFAPFDDSSDNNQFTLGFDVILFF